MQKKYININKINNTIFVMAFEIISTLLIAVALAMDAFSVSLTKGFTQKNLKSNLKYTKFIQMIV